jgi:DnaK suppressor protein
MTETPSLLNAMRMEEFGRRLREARRALLRTLATTDAEIATLGTHEAGAAVEDAARDATAAIFSRLEGREKHELDDIEDALARLEAGTFGLCERCGRPYSWLAFARCLRHATASTVSRRPRRHGEGTDGWPRRYPMNRRWISATLALLLPGLAARAVAQEGPVARGKQLFTEQGCYGCHMIENLAREARPTGAAAPQRVRQETSGRRTTKLPQIPQLPESLDGYLCRCAVNAWYMFC